MEGRTKIALAVIVAVGMMASIFAFGDVSELFGGEEGDGNGDDQSKGDANETYELLTKTLNNLY